jgi:hypothetical protein
LVDEVDGVHTFLDGEQFAIFLGPTNKRIAGRTALGPKRTTDYGSRNDRCAAVGLSVYTSQYVSKHQPILGCIRDR